MKYSQKDAHWNSLNAHCYWMLRKKEISALEATKQLEGQSVSWKNELLFSENITPAIKTIDSCVGNFASSSSRKSPVQTKRRKS